MPSTGAEGQCSGCGGGGGGVGPGRGEEREPSTEVGAPAESWGSGEDPLRQSERQGGCGGEGLGRVKTPGFAEGCNVGCGQRWPPASWPVCLVGGCAPWCGELMD